ncbi:ABC transporter ATP-binding protein [Eubacterium multiforme]|uniref:ABC-2 type transport system ATP-binding protein n=1 Tax=Eubacterium multiforme TaxID=83339 RepID=A0ABT9UU73_9FIRM|nr:ABC transporter ATP-binding protein [Eubacterium multiforme]MDQ0149873.1 ABC-2 type transport system ATP-binding protein [Eubacterium multiforme]
MEALRINSLTKYCNGKKIIKNISFDVNEGEIVGIAGPNGSGKSILMEMLLNFSSPSSGNISILGLDSKDKAKEIEDIVGYVPSEIAFSKNLKVKDIFKSKENNLEDKINDLCRKFQINKNKRIGELSFGNRKKVAIINAIIKNPKIIILDEPTSSVDEDVKKIIFEIILEENNKGTTILISSNNLNDIQKYCDKVVIIRKGKVIDIKNMKIIKNFLKKKIILKTNESMERDIRIFGGESVKREKNYIEFLYDGDINRLIKFLACYEIDDIVLEEENIIQNVFNYYK